MRRRSATLPRALVALMMVASMLGAACLLAGGCGGVETTPGDDAGADSGSGGGASDGGPDIVTTHPDAPPLPGETECTVTETTGILVKGAVHVPVCTPVEYATNPPSGGDHWPLWAAYAKHTVAVPREMYVHNLEHGAVVFAYRCPSSCPDVEKALGDLFDKVGDTLCLVPGGPVARVVLTPDPDLDTPIALAAWGATYTATCIDPPSMKAFLVKAYGHGTEATCANGIDPAGLIASCQDGGADGGNDDAGDGG
jgi:hypothetical protein